MMYDYKKKKIKPFDNFGSWAVNSSLRPKEPLKNGLVHGLSEENMQSLPSQNNSLNRQLFLGRKL